MCALANSGFGQVPPGDRALAGKFQNRTTSISLRTGHSAEVDWTRWCNLAKDCTTQGIQAWIDHSFVLGNDFSPSGASVKAQMATIPKGALHSEASDFYGPMRDALCGAGVPRNVAEVLAIETWAVWDAWMAAYHIEAPLFPLFAAWPLGPNGGIGTVVPPTRAPVPYPFGWGVSDAASYISGLDGRICSLVSQRGLTLESDDRKTIYNYASWYQSRFTAWRQSAFLTNLIGEGVVYAKDTAEGAAVGGVAGAATGAAAGGAVGAAAGAGIGATSGAAFFGVGAAPGAAVGAAIGGGAGVAEGAAIGGAGGAVAGAVAGSFLGKVAGPVRGNAVFQAQRF